MLQRRVSMTGKKNFTESKMELLLSEVEACKNVLFGMLSSDISSKCKRRGWESVCEAVNAVGSEKRTQAEMKKKWLKESNYIPFPPVYTGHSTLMTSL